MLWAYLQLLRQFWKLHFHKSYSDFLLYCEFCEQNSSSIFKFCLFVVRHNLTFSAIYDVLNHMFSLKFLTPIIHCELNPPSTHPRKIPKLEFSRCDQNFMQCEQLDDGRYWCFLFTSYHISSHPWIIFLFTPGSCFYSPLDHIFIHHWIPEKTSNSCFPVLFPPVFLGLPPVSLLEEALRQWKQLGRWWRILEPFPRWSQAIAANKPAQAHRSSRETHEKCFR